MTILIKHLLFFSTRDLFLSTRHSFHNIDPFCYLDVHIWTHPQSPHPPPPGGNAWTTQGDHTLLLSTVAYDNTVKNNETLTAHGSNVMTTVTYGQHKSWTSPRLGSLVWCSIVVHLSVFNLMTCRTANLCC